MTKGKGYPEHVLSKSKTYGDAYNKDIVGVENTEFPQSYIHQ